MEAPGITIVMSPLHSTGLPEPVAIAPPCCGTLTHDEATLVGMVLAAHRHGRPVFDALLCEMLPEDARDRLFGAALTFGRTAGL